MYRHCIYESCYFCCFYSRCIVYEIEDEEKKEECYYEPIIVIQPKVSIINDIRTLDYVKIDQLLNTINQCEYYNMKATQYAHLMEINNIIDSAILEQDIKEALYSFYSKRTTREQFICCDQINSLLTGSINREIARNKETNEICLFKFDATKFYFYDSTYNHHNES
jgi:hypothetical protein